VVLTDAIMPEMSGTELIRELRILRPELPVVLMSGYGGPALQAEADAVGVRRVLAKPLTQSDLAEALASVVRDIAPRRSEPPAAVADIRAHS
jgi:CheY-like chemotaxis protein